MRVGLGTGSTVHWTIVELGERVARRARHRVHGHVEPDRRAGHRCSASGSVSPDEIGRLDIAIDGADEVDPALNLTKGGGGAHTRREARRPDVAPLHRRRSTSRSSSPSSARSAPRSRCSTSPPASSPPGCRRWAPPASSPATTAATTATCCATPTSAPSPTPTLLAAPARAGARHRRARAVPGRHGRAGRRRPRRRHRPRADRSMIAAH